VPVISLHSVFDKNVACEMRLRTAAFHEFPSGHCPLFGVRMRGGLWIPGVGYALLFLGSGSSAWALRTCGVSGAAMTAGHSGRGGSPRASLPVGARCATVADAMGTWPMRVETHRTERCLEALPSRALRNKTAPEKTVISVFQKKACVI